MMIKICAFYYFKPLSAADVAQLKGELELMAAHQSLRGLVLIGREGINYTISGPDSGIDAFEAWLTTRLEIENPHFKHSWAMKHPFNEFVVKIKTEIVTLGTPELVPSGKHGHISPREWHEKLRTGKAIVLDTRNDYEVEIGKFRNAIDLGIKEFREFPEKLAKSGISKDQEVLIYCTGGIRCEKAILEMKRQGYERVNQLDGGILAYLEQFPNSEFEGECFVFDYRVAVDQNLQPTRRYRFCTHCGQPSETTIDCALCGQKGIVCRHCIDAGINTCTKNCANHARLGHKSRRPHFQELRLRQR